MFFGQDFLKVSNKEFKLLHEHSISVLSQATVQAVCLSIRFFILCFLNEEKKMKNELIIGNIFVQDNKH